MPGFEVVKAKTCALPQYSQAVVYGDTVYCSGDIGAVPGTNWELAKGTIKDRAVCHNIQARRETCFNMATNRYKLSRTSV